MSVNYSKFKSGISLFPDANPATNPPTQDGDIRYNSSTNKVELYNGAIDPIVTENDVATLTNKTLTSPVITPSTPNTVVITDGSGALAPSSTTPTELAYINNVTSDIQAQLNGKQPTITQLPIANGGTGQSTANAAFNALSPMTTGGDIIYGGASGSATRLANGSSGQVLLSNGGTAAPSWGTVLTNPMTTGGDIIYGNAGGVPNRLANGSSGQLLQSNGGTAAPSWTTPPVVGGYVLPGTIIQWAANTAPAGYLTADGSAISRTTYSSLFTNIGTTWGIGDGSTTFNLPDLRGYFLRGVDGSDGRDPEGLSRSAQVAGTFTNSGWNLSSGSSFVSGGSTVNLAPGMLVTGTNIPTSTYVKSIIDSTSFYLGNYNNTAFVTATGNGTLQSLTFGKSASAGYAGSEQLSAFYQHSHILNVGSTVVSNTPPTTTSYIQPASTGSGYIWSTAASIANTASIQSAGGTETRPINAYVLYCIKT